MSLVKSLFFFTFFVDGNWANNSGEIQTDNSLKELKGMSAMDAIKDMEPNALWRHNPMTKLLPQPELGMEWIHQVPFRTPHSLTKLSKPYQKGFNPYFRKSDFDFERRNKPITLVAIRKNGVAQRKAIYKSSLNSTTQVDPSVDYSVPRSSDSGDVAELQSPFNEVGNFWKEVVNA